MFKYSKVSFQNGNYPMLYKFTEILEFTSCYYYFIVNEVLVISWHQMCWRMNPACLKLFKNLWCFAVPKLISTVSISWMDLFPSHIVFSIVTYCDILDPLGTSIVTFILWHSWSSGYIYSIYGSYFLQTSEYWAS